MEDYSEGNAASAMGIVLTSFSQCHCVKEDKCMQLIANLAILFLVIQIAMLVIRKWVIAYIAQVITITLCVIYLILC